MQEIAALIESIRLDRRKVNEYKLIKEVALSCSKEDSDLSGELQSKLYNILMSAEVEQCVGLNGTALLEFTSLNNEDLTYEEKEKVREAVQRGLLNKKRTIFQELFELGITVEEKSLGTQSCLDLSIQDKVLVDFKHKLNESQRLYVRKLNELMETLEQIIKLKTKTLPDVANEEICACEVNMELCRLKIEILNSKARVGVFNETSSSMSAYREVIKGILKQQAECKQEIEELEELKEKYMQVSCKEYNEILKSYLQYKSNIVKKRLLYSQLRGQ